MRSRIRPYFEDTKNVFNPLIGVISVTAGQLKPTRAPSPVLSTESANVHIVGEILVGILDVAAPQAFPPPDGAHGGSGGPAQTRSAVLWARSRGASSRECFKNSDQNLIHCRSHVYGKISGMH